MTRTDIPAMLMQPKSGQRADLARKSADRQIYRSGFERLRLVVNEPTRPRRLSTPSADNAWDRLTAAIVMDRARKGELHPAIVEALCHAAGLP